MDPQERERTIREAVNYWMPIRWPVGDDWYEQRNTVTDDDGASVMVSKNDADPVAVVFTNDELYGSRLTSEAALARVYAVV